MQIHSFSEFISALPGFARWFLVLAVVYLPVLICFIILLGREDIFVVREFLKGFNFGRRFAILKRSTSADSALMRFCSWYLMVMLPFVYLIVLIYIYLGAVTLDFGRSIQTQMATLQGVPANQKELQIRYDRLPSDEAASAKLQSILPVTREAENHELYRTLLGGRHRPVLVSRLSAAEKQRLKDELAIQADDIVHLEELGRDDPVLKNPITFQGLDTELSYLAPLQNAAHLLTLSVIEKLAGQDSRKAELDAPAALEAINAEFVLARSLQAEPFRMAKVIQYSVLGSAVDGIEIVLNNTRLSSIQLTQLGDMATEALSQTSLTNAMMGEQVMGMMMFDLKGVKLQKIAGHRQPQRTTQVNWTGIDHRWRRAVNLDKMAFLEAMEKIRNQVRLPLAQRLNLFSPYQSLVDSEWTEGHYVSAVAIPDYEDSILRQATAETYLNCARVAIAIRRLEQDQKIPMRELSELVPKYLDSIPQDPFGNGLIGLESIRGWHLVYSVGRNRKSESGIVAGQRFELAGDDPGVYLSSILSN